MIGFRNTVAAVGLAALAATMGSPARAADADHPYTNVNHANDAGNNTGDSQTDRLNEQQLQRNRNGQYGGQARNGAGYGGRTAQGYGGQGYGRPGYGGPGYGGGPGYRGPGYGGPGYGGPDYGRPGYVGWRGGYGGVYPGYGYVGAYPYAVGYPYGPGVFPFAYGYGGPFYGRPFYRPFWGYRVGWRRW